MTWHIRPAREADVPGLPDLERAAGALFPEGRIPDPDATHSESEYRAWVRSEMAWVAVDADVPVGCVVASELDGALHVDELAVHPRFGRRGIGTRLMRRAMDEAARRGLPRVTLTTFEDLPWNAPFYRRLGFTILDGDNITAPLARILERETRAGLTHRVAMAFDVREPV